jgi:hypothetical protein
MYIQIYITEEITGMLSNMKAPATDIVKDLQTLKTKVDNIQASVDKILETQKELLQQLSKAKSSLDSTEALDSLPDVLVLLSLPSSLRQTIITIARIGESTADEISKETKRKRAMESAYANQLTRLGYLEKRRIGRKTYFRLKHSLPAQVI